MSFPATLDSLKNNWIDGEIRSGHSSTHNSIANLLLAIQTKIGITGSTDASSIQYFIDHHSHGNFYTKTEVDNALAGKQATLGITPESTGNRGVPNGYASLDAGGKVPDSQINLATIGRKVKTVVLGEDLPTPGYGSNVVKAFSTVGSNPGTHLVMGGRVRFNKRTKIVSVKYPHNASNGSAAIVIYSNTNVLLGTYPVPNGTKEATGINFVCEQGIDYQIGCNSTANFGNLHANQTLTAQNIADGFISGCHAFGNFDTNWRLQEVVIQEENQSSLPLSIVGRIQYTLALDVGASTSVSTASREGVRFTVPYATKLYEVRTWLNAYTTSAIILLMDSAGNTLTSLPMTNGTKTVNFNGYDLAANTEYKLVVNDSANWGGTRYYTAIANFLERFPYTSSGVYGAGAGTNDNSNVFHLEYIELDFLGKAYLAKANRIRETQFCKIDGFAQGPLSAGVNVSLSNYYGQVVSGFTGLVPGTAYYLSNSAGAIAATVGTYFTPVGIAVSSTELEITNYSALITASINDTVVWTGSGVYVYTRPRFVSEGLMMYTLTANGGANNGMRIQWSEDGNINGTWIDIGETSGSTLTERRMMVKKGFIRLRELTTANSGLTANIQVWQ